MTSVIDQIKNQINIVDIVSEYLDLHKKGRNYWGICPFHEDTNPSMSVSPEKQMFKCFVCGQGGSVINFVSEIEKITFGKALAKLGNKVGIEVQSSFEEKPKYNEKQQKLINALNDANDFFQYSLTAEEGIKALAYADERSLDPSVREKFKIGYAPNSGLIDFLKKKGHDEAVIMNAALMTQNGHDFYRNRLMYAISNRFGDVVAFSGRLLDGEGPKYINSIDSLVFNKSNLLYNLNNALDVIKKEKEVFILEGFMDVIAIDKVGHRNAVAIMGTALTEAHIKQLRDVHVTLMLDSDQAGINASLKSIKLLLKYKLPVSVIYNKEGKDADEILTSKGKEVLKGIIKNKIPALKFVYAVTKKINSADSPEGINDLVKEFSKYLAYASDLEKDFYVNKISKEFGISIEVISSMIPSYTVKKLKLPDEQENTLEIKVQNHSYILIRSMLEKPMLIETLKKNPAHFNDAMLLGIAKYLVALKDKRNYKINPETKAMIKLIIKETDGIPKNNIPNTHEEFNDLINIVNNNANNELKSSVGVKLSKAESKEKVNFLEQLVEIERKKRK